LELPPPPPPQLLFSLYKIDRECFIIIIFVNGAAFLFVMVCSFRNYAGSAIM
jgi:hypothetical protein